MGLSWISQHIASRFQASYFRLFPSGRILLLSHSETRLQNAIITHQTWQQIVFFFMQSGSPTGNQSRGLHTPVAQLLLQHPLHQALSSAHILCHREVAYSTPLTAGVFQEQKSLLCQQLVYCMVQDPTLPLTIISNFSS